MARIRTIKPEFFRHYDLWTAEQESGLPLRVAYAGLWCAIDRAGRFKWRPHELKVQILPYDTIDFAQVLDALARHGFVRRYEVDGEIYGVVPSFTRNQVIDARERASKLPGPDMDMSTTSPRDVVDGKEGKGKEGKGRERKGKERRSGRAGRAGRGRCGFQPGRPCRLSLP